MRNVPAFAKVLILPLLAAASLLGVYYFSGKTDQKAVVKTQETVQETSAFEEEIENHCKDYSDYADHPPM